MKTSTPVILRASPNEFTADAPGRVAVAPNQRLESDDRIEWPTTISSVILSVGKTNDETMSPLPANRLVHSSDTDLGGGNSRVSSLRLLYGNIVRKLANMQANLGEVLMSWRAFDTLIFGLRVRNHDV